MSSSAFGQGRPTATLAPAAPLALPGRADSNSPAVWQLVDGTPELRVLTSIAGWTWLSAGPGSEELGAPAPVQWSTHPGEGVWIESVQADDSGAWLGVYHNEIPARLCGRPDRMLPRIGAARSLDHGATWEDLGIILEAPPGWHDCATRNRYFVGGVGDVSAVLDRDQRYLYLFFSQYSRFADAQGVAVARLPWATRDEPVGRVEVWNGAWLPARQRDAFDEAGELVSHWTYDAGTPLWPVRSPWHDRQTAGDAFWGPSVHWNTHLGMYVMLLNRTRDDDWTQDGIYVSYSASLDDPYGWSQPELLLSGGAWYPQVLGLEPGEGTDRVASARARLFIGGISNYLIEFGLR